MVLDAVSNFVRGSTDAAVGTSDTTVSVADASIFPDPETDGEFNVVIWDVNNFPRPDQDGDVEILRVTARDTTADELTVTRGQEMTSAAAHPEGSAIHLSPTAKMFTDIEDTFTTEAEAADAAPVQSVFDRVGDVVAETGDYAATQISNFSSEVLTSISGSTIAPSEITDLWNGTVVTADVNNTNTTTEALEAERAVMGDGHYFAESSDTVSEILNNTTNGDRIHLTRGSYGATTLDSGERRFWDGTNGQTGDGTEITGEWNINEDRTIFKNIAIGDEKLQVNGVLFVISNSLLFGNGVIEIDNDFATVSHITGSGSINFASGTSDGEIGIIDQRIDVTDNGNNSILGGA